MGQKDEKEYHFLREVKKEKRWQPKQFVICACICVIGAILFGAIAAITFAKVYPYFEPKEEIPKVEIPQEDPTPTPVPETTSVKETNTSASEDQEANMEDIRSIYKDVINSAKEPEKALVTVQGITNSVDWMNNSFENSKQVSGFLVADNGKEYFVLTEYRVVEKVDRILVTFIDGTTVDAHFQKQDAGTGLAILKIDKDEVDDEVQDKIAIAELGSSALIQRGEPVLAVGSPTGYKGSVVYGMVTSVENIKTTVDNEYHILVTDIMGDKEGSGVLLSLEGKVVGVIVQSLSLTEDKCVVTALPISELKQMIELLSNNEERVYLGVRGQDIATALSAKTGIPKGIYVNSVEEDSPAMVGGIQNGDVIVKIGDDSIETLSQLRRALDKCSKGEKIKISAMRKGAEGYVEIVFDVTLGAL
ncbi:MAG: S1C family serine protease [Ruminococcus sp.]|nr:S1C family serine protease [Ruminococcus sp.]